MKRDPIHEKAIRLIEGGVVEVDSHFVRIKQSSCEWDICGLCEMDSICHEGTEMCHVCRECDEITDKHCWLELVTKHNEVKQ